MKVRLCLCIPVFDNSGTIETVIADCLRHTSYPVLVVDDGSRVPVVEQLRSDFVKDALESGRCTVLRLDRNQGKGAALQRGFQEALARGFTHVLSLDGDGQHLVSEIPKLVEKAEQDPWALVVGNRRFVGPHVPKASKFGRRFSNFWVQYQTGAAVHDSQSGFRLYPLLPLQCMRFWTKGYEFEIEVLIRLLWRNLRVVEVSTDVLYPEPKERVSHFHKFWDNARISALNTVLVTMRLLKTNPRPFEAALALGLGICIGSTPFFGFHTLIAGLFALVFRLNAAMLILGTQISLPPMIPFLILGSIRLGTWILNVPFPTGLVPLTLSKAGHYYLYWMIGSFVLGPCLGLVLGGAAFWSFKYFKALKRGSPSWNGRMRGGFGNHLLKLIAKAFGIQAAYACLYLVVPYFYLFAPRARRASLEYWGLIAPEAGWFRRRLLVLAHLRKFGQLLLDRVYQAQSSGPRFHLRSDGFEHIRNCLDAGEGVILLGAHLGGWDLAASYIYHHEVNEPLHLLQYEAKGVTLNKLKETNERLPPRPIFTNLESQPILSLHALLNQGQAVALMGDRPVGRHYELVNFLGKLAPFDTSAFKVAATCRKPLVITFGFKGPGKSYEFYALPARYYTYPAGIDRTDACRQWAQEFAATLETFVRRYPDQWTNFFPFWSTPVAPPKTEPSPAVKPPLPIPALPLQLEPS